MPPVAPHPGALEALEQKLLGARPHLTQEEVAEQAGITLDVARHLWHLLGFAHTAPGEVAFTDADVHALRLTSDLIGMGVLSQDRQDGLVRTWGRSFARLAEWEVALLGDIAAESGADPTDGLLAIADEVLPRVEALQTYAWRRHLLSAGSRLIAERESGSASTLAVCFVDIVGYTSQSRALTDRELVSWLEAFESAVLGITVDRGARIIKNIGDELLLVADDPAQMAEIALELTARGADEDDLFPAVRAGVAYGEVVTRLGDVFGPVVNIAARLTSVARPNTVLVDRGMHEALSEAGPGDEPDPEPEAASYRLRRLRRVSVKGYSRLHVWCLQQPRSA
ncbi:adenylate/guanylate cyclase domain-containing protein [Nocardioides sp.]|nr:adenylate/guanylate cyclase domain-containing protein [Nocardioides sp.]